MFSGSGLGLAVEDGSMEQVTLAEAKEQLDDLMQRAARGEDVRIVDAKLGTVQLTPVVPVDHVNAAGPLDTRVTPVKRGQKRRLGQFEGKMQAPNNLMEPMTEEELRDWYGPDA
jgi:antitoxin (DNA-binding transcriptional repressor) of toxin-antitoxin stability system